jgi:hypothetical protein
MTGKSGVNRDQLRKKKAEKTQTNSPQLRREERNRSRNRVGLHYVRAHG